MPVYNIAAPEIPPTALRFPAGRSGVWFYRV